MHHTTRLVAGLALCIAAAGVMIAGIINEGIGLTVGTMGMLIVASATTHRTSGSKRGTST